MFPGRIEISVPMRLNIWIWPVTRASFAGDAPRAFRRRCSFATSARARRTAHLAGMNGKRAPGSGLSRPRRGDASVRKSIALIVRQAGHRTKPAAMAAPIVGENSIGICLAWRSFQAAIRPLGILKHVGIGRSTSHGLLFGKLSALILHLASAVKAHCPILP